MLHFACRATKGKFTIRNAVLIVNRVSTIHSKYSDETALDVNMCNFSYEI